MQVLAARISEGYTETAQAHERWRSIVARLRKVGLDAKHHGDAVTVGFADGSYAVEVTAGTLRPFIGGVWVDGFPRGNVNAEHVEFYLRELLSAIRSYLATA